MEITKCVEDNLKHEDNPHLYVRKQCFVYVKKSRRAPRTARSWQATGSEDTMSRGQTNSWFVSTSDFCSKFMSELFLELSSCLRLPTEQTMDEQPQGRHVHPGMYSANQLVLTVENRDSMAFLAAVFTGRVDKAQELLALPWTNINAQYANGNTPLILAVQGNSEKLVQMLICHPNINVNLRGSDGFTALIKACGQEKLSFIIMILSHPHTNVNLSTYYGETALTHAIRNGNEEAVQLLLRRPDIDVNTQSCGGRPMGILGANLGENALIESVVYRRHTIAKTLVLRGDTLLDVVDERDRTPLIMATQYGYTSLVRLLLRHGCDPYAEDDHGHNALYYAVKRGSLELVEDILQSLCKEPQTLTRICRTVIRRQLRLNFGRGDSLKIVLDRFPKNTLPRTLKRFLAFEA